MKYHFINNYFILFIQRIKSTFYSIVILEGPPPPIQDE